MIDVPGGTGKPPGWRSAAPNTGRRHAGTVEQARVILTILINLSKMPRAHQEMPLDTIAAAEAKTNFGALLDKAQRGPVTISKNGRPVAVLMSAEAFEEHQQAKLRVLRAEVEKGLEDMRAGRVKNLEEVFAALDAQDDD